MTAQEGGTPEEPSSSAGLRKRRSEFGVAKANGAGGAGGQGGGSHTGGAPEACVAVDLSARASITKYHQLGGLNDRHVFSHRSGGWESEVRVSAALVLLRL